ncbi:GATA zinc finger domain-containing protein 15-like [Copidosoma floridanum]|uniref:GATA zinc finger domain-containing protein 15-like n=1 Tax=Copidosoma floridanum TaxID=29053 RepID=UPI000C6F7F3B|nr:GATA zinc finger domain-containing protein 15-like [Copidosoma floridanum]
MALINDRKTLRVNGREPKGNYNYCQRPGHYARNCCSQNTNINTNAYNFGGKNDKYNNYNNHNKYNRGYNNGPSESYNRYNNYYNRNNNYNTGNNGNSKYNNTNTNYYDRNDYNNRYNNYNPTGSNYYFNHSYGDPYNDNNGDTSNRYENDYTNQDSIIEETARQVTIVDVCVPFENRREALGQARRKKLSKYQPIVDKLTKLTGLPRRGGGLYCGCAWCVEWPQREGPRPTEDQQMVRQNDEKFYGE